MPRITVWKCPHTGYLFEDKKEYNAHLKQESRMRIKAREYKKITNSIDSVIAKVSELSSVKEIVDYIMINQREFILRGLRNSGSDIELIDAMKKGYTINFDASLTRLEIQTRWSEEVSNSHRCPRTGKRNWGGRESKNGVPRGYPGFAGMISSLAEGSKYITIVRPHTRNIKIEFPSLSDMVNGPTGVGTGSGTGGMNSQYGVEIFASDFPAMQKCVENTKLISLIKDPSGESLSQDLDYLGSGTAILEDLV